ncbi:MAG: 30S ribosome-binding factor RbfA [Ignavibacteria bacterium]|nr:30S ribosome-binding factor RbfA [Bacteroidota bacterium]MSQ45411.1 30S ribosome-binding factor RbfA [Ignavibacteria bacterium]
MSIRMEKISSVVRHCIGEYLSREITSPPYNFTTVSDVVVSPDIRHAKIYISIFGNEDQKKKTLNHITSKRNEIKHILGKHLQTKFTPAIHFYLDDTLEKVDHLEKLFKEIHKSD